MPSVSINGSAGRERPIDILVFLKGSDTALEMNGKPNVIAVEESDVLSVRVIKSRISGSVSSAIGLPDVSSLLVSLHSPALDEALRIVSSSVIDDDQFPIVQRLVCDRRESIGNEACSIVGGQDDADFGHSEQAQKVR